MSCDEKIEQLRHIISDSIRPLLSDRVVIVDAPYYENIGDLLIWRGTTDFLRENGFKLLHSYGAGYFPFPNLDKDIIAGARCKMPYPGRDRRDFGRTGLSECRSLPGRGQKGINRSDAPSNLNLFQLSPYPDSRLTAGALQFDSLDSGQ